MDQSQPLFVYFRPILITISIMQIEKSIDGVLGIRTDDRRRVGAEDTYHRAMVAASTNMKCCHACAASNVLVCYKHNSLLLFIQVYL